MEEKITICMVIYGIQMIKNGKTRDNKVKFIPIDENKLIYSYSRASRALDNANYDPTDTVRKKFKSKKPKKRNGNNKKNRTRL